MTRWLAVLGMVILPMAMTVWALAAPEATPLPAKGNLFREAVRSKLATLHLEYRDAIWPSQAELEKKVDPSLVPAAVTERAERWVNTILKEEWVPTDLARRFIPLTRTVPTVPPDQVDYLVARYKVSVTQIQIEETGVSLSVLITPEGGSPASDVESYIKSAAARYLNLPPEVLAKGELKLKSEGLSDGGRLYYGTMDYKYEPLMRNRAWWNHTYLWSDGKSLYFHTLERTGTEPARGPELQQAKPGIPPRFER